MFDKLTEIVHCFSINDLKLETERKFVIDFLPYCQLGKTSWNYDFFLARSWKSIGFKISAFAAKPAKLRKYAATASCEKRFHGFVLPVTLPILKTCRFRRNTKTTVIPVAFCYITLTVQTVFPISRLLGNF